MSAQISNELLFTSHTCKVVSLFSYKPSGPASQTTKRLFLNFCFVLVTWPDLSSLAKNGTHAPCSGIAESQPLDCQAITDSSLKTPT